MFKRNRTPQKKKNNSKRVLVVGAGLGGMAAALRLACAGHRVEVWEKNATPGGKLQERCAEGFRWDLGPSLLTMPHVLDALFAAAGEKREAWLTLERLPSACRYFWGDGTMIDEDAALWARPDVARFLAHAEGIDALSGEAFLHYPPSEFWRAFTWRNLSHLRHLPKVMNFRTLEKEIARHFPYPGDPKLRQLFARFATYNGSHPARTPATFSIIPYIEARYGAWYVRGGMAAIGRAVHQLAEAKGVVFRFGAEARSWGKEGATHRVEDSEGTVSRFDEVICNQDVLRASQGWLRAAFSEGERTALLKPALSTSALVVTLGLAERLPAIGHHSIFFSSDYAAEFADLFDRHALPEEPTVYLSSTCRSDPSDAPLGGENVFLLINAPSGATSNPEEYVARVCAALPRRFPHLALPDLWSAAVPGTRQIFTPADFARRDNSQHGALYGWASHSLRTAFLRPSIARRGVDGLHFVGGTTHPGGGIPLVLLSANMVAERVDLRS